MARCPKRCEISPAHQEITQSARDDGFLFRCLSNKRVSVLLLAVCVSFATHADQAPTFKPFMSGEGSFTSSQMGGVQYTLANFATLTTVTTNQGWGGRLAVGVLHSMTDRYSFTAELGGGYYGQNNLDPHIFVVNPRVEIIPLPGSAGISMKHSGLDLIAGVMYTQPRYALFFKAGAFFENMLVHAFFNPSRIFQTSVLQNLADTMSITQENLPNPIETTKNIRLVQPEIKLGAAYNLTENWVVIGSWIHTFGSPFSIQGSITNFTPLTYGSTNLAVATPSLDIAMVGIEYRFG